MSWPKQFFAGDYVAVKSDNCIGQISSVYCGPHSTGDWWWVFDPIDGTPRRELRRSQMRSVTALEALAMQGD